MSMTKAEPKKRGRPPAMDAKQKAATEKQLEGIAHKINSRLERAAAQENKADDHRLAAAIHLEEARQACKGTPIKFRAWVDKNVSQSYETVKTLVRIGAADDPKLALEDLRKGTAKANRESRARAKVSRETPAPAEDTGSEPVTGLVPPYQQATDAFDALGARDKLKLISHACNDTGCMATFEGLPLEGLGGGEMKRKRKCR